MFKYELVDVALDAAADFDALRTGRINFCNGVPRFLAAMNEAFPHIGTSAMNQIAPRDVLLVKEVLGRIAPASRQLASEIVADLYVWLSDIEMAWNEQHYDHKYIVALMTWSKIAAARLGSRGHTLTTDC